MKSKSDNDRVTRFADYLDKVYKRRSSVSTWNMSEILYLEVKNRLQKCKPKYYHIMLLMSHATCREMNNYINH